MNGICGTCGREAEATESNEGYSDCCNDRIEYGLEASETVARCLQDSQEHIVAMTKRIASLSSTISKGNKNRVNLLTDADFKRLEDERENCKAWKRIAKQDVKYLTKLQATFNQRVCY